MLRLQVCGYLLPLVFGLFFQAPLAWASLPYKTNTVPAETPKILDDSGIVEKLGAELDLQNIFLRDENGQQKALKEYFQSGRPTLLALVYYNCPNLCNVVLNNLVSSLKDVNWTPGQEFELLTVSIDPSEDAELAKAKKENYLKEYGRPESAKGWHFLTGEEKHLRALSSAVGFGYNWDETTQQWAHAAAIFFLSPEGKLTRLIYGVTYPPAQVKLALNEAASGTVGSIIDRVMFYCFRYDPSTRKYSLYVYRVVQASSLAMVLIMGTTLYMTFGRRHRKRKTQSAGERNEA